MGQFCFGCMRSNYVEKWFQWKKPCSGVPSEIGWDLGLFTRVLTQGRMILEQQNTRNYKGLNTTAHMCIWCSYEQLDTKWSQANCHC